MRYGAYTHPAFLDVYFVCLKAYFIKEKDAYKLTIMWMSKRHGRELAKDKLCLSREKCTEFVPLNSL
jgi:hypothetical protein